jgi:hypothetical protein
MKSACFIVPLAFFVTSKTVGNSAFALCYPICPSVGTLRFSRHILPFFILEVETRDNLVFSASQMRKNGKNNMQFSQIYFLYIDIINEN